MKTKLAKQIMTEFKGLTGRNKAKTIRAMSYEERGALSAVALDLFSLKKDTKLNTTHQNQIVDAATILHRHVTL